MHIAGRVSTPTISEAKRCQGGDVCRGVIRRAFRRSGYFTALKRLPPVRSAGFQALKLGRETQVVPRIGNGCRFAEVSLERSACRHRPSNARIKDLAHLPGNLAHGERLSQERQSQLDNELSTPRGAVAHE